MVLREMGVLFSPHFSFSILWCAWARIMLKYLTIVNDTNKLKLTMYYIAKGVKHSQGIACVAPLLAMTTFQGRSLYYEVTAKRCISSLLF